MAQKEEKQTYRESTVEALVGALVSIANLNKEQIPAVKSAINAAWADGVSYTCLDWYEAYEQLRPEDKLNFACDSLFSMLRRRLCRDATEKLSGKALRTFLKNKDKAIARYVEEEGADRETKFPVMVVTVHVTHHN